MATKISRSHDLSTTAPGVIGGDVKDTDNLPLALYTLDDSVPAAEIHFLASRLEGEYVIDIDDGSYIHLIQPAPEALLRQSTLKTTLDAHLQYGNENRARLEFNPFIFVVVHDRNWDGQGIWIVHVDFEDGNLVTAFRVKVEDAGSVCATLRDDEEGAEVLKEQYGLDAS